MKEEIIIAGFGGQGVLSMGKILAYCAIMQDMEVTWMPSYGPEMRGGTANVCVIVSDRKISSPIVTKYDTAIILNQQSLDKFESTVKPGGLLIYDPNHQPSDKNRYKGVQDRRHQRCRTGRKLEGIQHGCHGSISQDEAYRFIREHRQGTCKMHPCTLCRPHRA